MSLCRPGKIFSEDERRIYIRQLTVQIKAWGISLGLRSSKQYHPL